MADQLIIDGVSYDMPESFTIGEARILKRYTGLNLAELEGANASDPNFMAAVIHIAFSRANPATPFAQIEAVIDQIQLENIEVVAEEVADPPALAPSPVNGANEKPSGEDGPTDSAPTPATSNLAATGARP